MPEGPSIVILREAASGLAGQKVVNAHGNAKIDQARLMHRRLIAVRSWGKHLLLEFEDFTVRIHLLMFGTYRINERKPEGRPRLSLQFEDGQELNVYTCSVQFIDQPLDQVYDWRADVMSPQWDDALALKKLQAQPHMLVCDAILDQTVFAGAGNIFKNEVLFRLRMHPLSVIGALPAEKLAELVDQTHRYGGEFLAWKKAGVLKKHWLAHTKRICPRCEIAFSTGKLGKTSRRSFFCEQCQRRYLLSQGVALPRPDCPLCGRPNACAPATSGDLTTPCWCRQVAFSERSLGKIPRAARGLSCICKACAGAADGPANPPRNE